MTKSTRRPLLGGLVGVGADDDLGRIREYGLSKGFLPTDPVEAGAPPHSTPAPTVSPRPAPSPPVVVRPAPTKPWQAMFPDYLIEELRQAAAREGTAQKVVVMRALQMAGFRVDPIDLQDLRRR